MKSLDEDECSEACEGDVAAEWTTEEMIEVYDNLPSEKLQGDPIPMSVPTSSVPLWDDNRMDMALGEAVAVKRMDKALDKVLVKAATVMSDDFGLKPHEETAVGDCGPVSVTSEVFDSGRSQRATVQQARAGWMDL
eukprot:gnl/MRDRNA2_/MRDRNA2_255716_c0_seq1.p1 gnl/MRDRNA2_/MRDRNA2_255716_c0~~gnl/MRDRNA2_/MRDRNA2_255716_c0_seq1.p1  ORF type:complete len:149 (-),score=47.45 gnl/MRDRNA2_/MRDRNA2_255716_c0_seq1:124-531(-)